MNGKMVIGLIVMAISLIAIANAAPDNIVMGPYNVSFDIGQRGVGYTVYTLPPKYSETLSGYKEASYYFVLLNSTAGNTAVVEIRTTDEPANEITPDWFGEDALRSTLPSGLDYVKSAHRVIDGNPGVVVEAFSPAEKTKSYFVSYKITKENSTDVTIVTRWPWYPDTAKLLDTIHVERVK